MNKDNKIEMKKIYADVLKKIMENNKTIIVCDADLANSSGATPNI